MAILIVNYKPTPEESQQISQARGVNIRTTCRAMVLNENEDGTLNLSVKPDGDASSFYKENVSLGSGEGQYQIV